MRKKCLSLMFLAGTLAYAQPPRKDPSEIGKGLDTEEIAQAFGVLSISQEESQGNEEPVIEGKTIEEIFAPALEDLSPTERENAIKTLQNKPQEPEPQKPPKEKPVIEGKTIEEIFAPALEDLSPTEREAYVAVLNEANLTTQMSFVLSAARDKLDRNREELDRRLAEEKKELDRRLAEEREERAKSFASLKRFINDMCNKISKNPIEEKWLYAQLGRSFTGRGSSQLDKRGGFIFDVYKKLTKIDEEFQDPKKEKKSQLMEIRNILRGGRNTEEEYWDPKKETTAQLIKLSTVKDAVEESKDAEDSSRYVLLHKKFINEKLDFLSSLNPLPSLEVLAKSIKSSEDDEKMAFYKEFLKFNRIFDPSTMKFKNAREMGVIDGFTLRDMLRAADTLQRIIKLYKDVKEENR